MPSAVEPFRDAACRVHVLAAGEAVREQRIGVRLRRRAVEQRGEPLALRVGEIESFGRHRRLHAFGRRRTAASLPERQLWPSRGGAPAGVLNPTPSRFRPMGNRASGRVVRHGGKRGKFRCPCTEISGSALTNVVRLAQKAGTRRERDLFLDMATAWLGLPNRATARASCMAACSPAACTRHRATTERPGKPNSTPLFDRSQAQAIET